MEGEVKGMQTVNLERLFLSSQYGISTSLTAKGKYACLRMNNLVNGKLDFSILKYAKIDQTTFETYAVEEGDILFNRTNSIELVGKVALVDRAVTAVFASYLIRLKPNLKAAYPNFACHLLNSELWQAKMKSIATQGVSQSNINITNLLRLKVCIPDSISQKRIAKLLDAVDTAIEKNRDLTNQTEASRGALMQSLLFTNTKNTDQIRLGELFTERRESGKPALPILSVTMNQGLVKRDDLGRKVDSQLTPEQHLLVRKDDIAYNMMRMWQGVSGLAECDGIVSPAYVVLKPTDLIDSRYASYLFKLPEIIRLFHRFSQGLTNDRLRLYYDQFKDIKVTVPKSVKEQTKIAQLLATYDQRIASLSSQSKQLTKVKTALSQKIFN